MILKEKQVSKDSKKKCKKKANPVIKKKFKTKKLQRQVKEIKRNHQNF